MNLKNKKLRKISTLSFDEHEQVEIEVDHVRDKEKDPSPAFGDRADDKMK